MKHIKPISLDEELSPRQKICELKKLYYSYQAVPKKIIENTVKRKEESLNLLTKYKMVINVDKFLEKECEKILEDTGLEAGFCGEYILGTPHAILNSVYYAGLLKRGSQFIFDCKLVLVEDLDEADTRLERLELVKISPPSWYEAGYYYQVSLDTNLYLEEWWLLGN